LTRGDLVVVALAGDYGKPRPGLVVQADAFAALPSVTVLPLTSEISAEHLVWITVRPSRQNGLRSTSQIIIDKVSTVPRTKVGNRFGHVDVTTMRAVDGALAGFLGLG
jgi:mRNA interferase MazF